MAKITISLCALMGVLLVLVSVGETRKPVCCSKFYTDPLPLHRLCGFSVDRTCRLNQVTFLTVRNRIICADPEQQWVQNAMEFIKNNMVSGDTAAMCKAIRQ